MTSSASPAVSNWLSMPSRARTSIVRWEIRKSEVPEKAHLFFIFHPPEFLSIFVPLDSIENLYDHVRPLPKLICVDAIHCGVRRIAGTDRGENNDEPFGSIRTRVSKIRGNVWRAGQGISCFAGGNRPGSGNLRHGIRFRGYSLPSRTESAI